ncbi:MAG: hypothetical protein ABI810_21485 [Sphingomonas bacterium]
MIIWFLAPALLQLSPVPDVIRNADDPLVSRFLRAIDAGSASEVTAVTEGRLFKVQGNKVFVRVRSTEFLLDIDGCIHDEITQSPSTREIDVKWGCPWQADVRWNGHRHEDMRTYVTTIRFTAGVPSYFYHELPLGGRSPPTLKQQSCDMLRDARDQAVTLSTDVEAALKAACTG